MKKNLSTISIILVLAVVVILASACSAATPAPAAPTIAPAQPTAKATQPSAPTSQPSAAATSTKPPVASTQPAATATQPAATATLVAAARPDLQPIVAAFAKTKTATAFKVAENLSGNGTIVQFSPSMPPSIVLVGAEGEFKGKDSHVKLSGLAGMLLSDDPAKGIEVTQVGGKMYVHGPASALNAPTDNWYVLDANSGFTMTFSVADNLDSLAAANGDWSQFKKSRSETFDGKKCDVYSGGKDAAGTIVQTVSKPILSSLVADSGSTDMWICDDGYLHNLTATVQAHDPTTPSKSGKIDVTFHIFEQDGNITIAAPANALAAVGTNNAAPTSAPAPTKSAGNSGQATATSTDGHWEGTTSSDSSISFDVDNKQITYINLNYNVQAGSCSLSGSYGKTPDNAQIKGSTVALQFTDSDGLQFIFGGNFTSNTQANGTLEVKGPTTNCGAIDAKSTWTAQNTPPDAQPTPSSSSSTGIGTSMDATDVLMAFFDAINAKDLDTAMNFVQDDVIVNAGSTTIMGAADLKTYLQKQTARNITYTASSLNSIGDIVNFSLKTSDQASAVKGDTAIVQDGQIQILTLH